MDVSPCSLARASNRNEFKDQASGDSLFQIEDAIDHVLREFIAIAKAVIVVALLKHDIDHPPREAKLRRRSF